MVFLILYIDFLWISWIDEFGGLNNVIKLLFLNLTFHFNRSSITRASELYGAFASEMPLGDATLWCCTSPGCTYR